MPKNKALRDQFIALTLTVLTCFILIGFLYLEILFLNTFMHEQISLHIKLGGVLVGVVIYLKTSIDFAMFIGRLMDKNPGLKGRIGIEIGTALGNAVGTMAILLIWSFFKEVSWLLAIMILLAALVLMKLAEDSLEHVDIEHLPYPGPIKKLIQVFAKVLKATNKITNPFLSKIVPKSSLSVETKIGLLSLLATAFTVPFILGLDDFAGYVPLFNVVNVFAFGIGVFVGHMILNIFLYISPKRTIAIVKNSVISILGSVAFVILAIWGAIEAIKLLFHLG